MNRSTSRLVDPQRIFRRLKENPILIGSTMKCHLISRMNISWKLTNYPWIKQKKEKLAKVGSIFISASKIEVIKNGNHSSNPIFLMKIILKKIKTIFDIVKLSCKSEFSHFCHLCILIEIQYSFLRGARSLKTS